MNFPNPNIKPVNEDVLNYCLDRYDKEKELMRSNVFYNPSGGVARSIFSFIDDLDSCGETFCIYCGYTNFTLNDNA